MHNGGQGSFQTVAASSAFDDSAPACSASVDHNRGREGVVPEAATMGFSNAHVNFRNVGFHFLEHVSHQLALRWHGFQELIQKNRCLHSHLLRPMCLMIECLIMVMI
ncbi:hypothetical protein V6N13_059759 [Hibiscus sabdariffa]